MQRWLALFLYAVVSAASAADVHLEWDLPTDLSGIDGYEIHHGDTSGDYTRLQDVPGAATTSTTIQDVEVPEYFSARSRNVDGSEVSLFSNEVLDAGQTRPEDQLALLVMRGSGGGQSSTITDWGDQTEYSQAIPVDGVFNFVGGVIDGDCVVDEVIFTCTAFTTGRVALFTGGTSSANPTGATLLEDLGTQTMSGCASQTVWTSTTNPFIASGTRVWFGFQSNSATGWRGNSVAGFDPGNPFDAHVSVTGDNNNDAWYSTVPSVTPSDVDFQPATFLTCVQ